MQYSNRARLPSSRRGGRAWLKIVMGILAAAVLAVGVRFVLHAGGGSTSVANSPIEDHHVKIVLHSRDAARFEFDANIDGKIRIPTTSAAPTERPAPLTVSVGSRAADVSAAAFGLADGATICLPRPMISRRLNEKKVDYNLRVLRQRRYAIVTIAAPGRFGFHRQTSRWMTNFTLYNKYLYAKNRSYDLHVHGLGSLEPTLPPSWSKIKVIRRHLAAYDYVAWVDADVLFTNFDKGFEDIVNEHPYDELLLAEDHNGINAGVMLFKSTQKMMALLDEVWHFDGNKGHIWQEQYALAQVIRRRPKFEQAVAIIPNQEINAYPYTASNQKERWEKGNLLVHFANCDSAPLSCLEAFEFYWKYWTEQHYMPRVTRRDIRYLPHHFHLVHV